ncbi:MAG: methionine--tRNA ligase [Kiritimatiellae bacterium]|nr:methionine--tRNA ligase [Kiritimatiellia bacterium]
MNQTKRKIVVTSALPYANGNIHLGHLVEYLQTDFWVRFQKMRGHACVYVCADDTHGTPIMVRARKEGIAPEELIARSHEAHLRDFTDFEIAFDNYYSTNSPENKAFSEKFYEAMVKSGGITRKSAPQLYCDHCKMFLPDSFVKGVCPKCGAPNQYGDNCDHCGSTYSAAELGSPACTTCGGSPSIKEDEHLYFELEPQHDYLAKWIPEHTTSDVSNKLMEWFSEPLRGWCISRSSPYFGFRIPGTDDKFFYVWVDAPIGYLASLQNWCTAHGESFDDWWQNPAAERYHFIGKDIIRFHCLFWPGMLHVAGFAQPDKIFVHGFLTVNGKKMSKSKGTFVNARTYLKHLPAAALRYYFAAKLSGTTDDMDLNLTDFVHRVNSDLVGKITNLASRGAQMLQKHFEGRMGEMDAEGEAVWKRAVSVADRIAEEYEARDFSKVIVDVRELVDAANEYFDKMSPWSLVKTDPEATRKVLTSILAVFRVLAIYLAPILPAYAQKVATLFGEPAFTWDALQKRIDGGVIGKYEYLATRIDPKAVEALIAESVVPETPAAKPAAPAAEPVKEEIGIDAFSKVDLRVAKILEAAPVEGSDKLIRFLLDVGEAKPRTVFSGIRKAYPEPEKLVGRSVVMVANLAPRKMRFGVSEGMVLAAGNRDGGLFLLSPDSGAMPGSVVS